MFNKILRSLVVLTVSLLLAVPAIAADKVVLHGASQFDDEVVRLQMHVLYPILVLPALQRFKIDVVFDPRADKKSVQPKSVVSADSILNPDEQEQEAIRRLQQNLPIVSRPFAVIAKAIGISGWL